MTASWQGEDEMDPLACVVSLSQGVAFGVKLSDDLLEASKVRFHLDENHARRPIQSEVNRPSPGTWNGCLDRRPPAWMGLNQKTFDDSSLSRITDTRAGSSKDA